MENKKKYSYLVCMPLMIYVIYAIQQILIKKVAVHIWDNYTYTVFVSAVVTIVSLLLIGGLLGGLLFLESGFSRNKIVSSICIFYSIIPVCMCIGLYFVDIPVDLLWTKAIYDAPLISAFYFMLWLKGRTDKRKYNIEEE
ncbi:hypothetical protein [Sinanaerobacter sp. ZZT-01]|uniref:hypothetical protein n=1 Tax=Sinanaerobacter sp. ZZT-01 TaxID=3111540 RepID=UPI002D786867|nr:hypothetical protein [Sinanaerobacter sp. ZZT-01]WRR93481.1 hypothetical protein U5921_15845 [Sinanaerobacter sp. ZZT-01]